VNLEIYYEPDPAWYIIGDHDIGNEYKVNFPNGSFTEKYKDASGRFCNISADELLEKHNIVLISWDISQLIMNNFAVTKKN